MVKSFETDKHSAVKIQAVIFDIDGQLYGINILMLDEVLPILEIKPIPKGPEFLEGVINLRGRIVPVVYLRKILGYCRQAFTSESRILMASFDGRKIGFIVDGARDVLEFRPDQIHPPVVKADQARFIEEVVKLESGDMVQLMTISKILPEESLGHLMTATLLKDI